MKKILIIGSGDSVFVKDFISKISAQDVTVDLISFSDAPKIDGVKKQINIASDNKAGEGVLSRQVELFLKTRKALKKMEPKYDAIILHFVFFFLAPHVFLMRGMTTNIVAVIWGSDFYRSGRVKGLIQAIIYFFSKSIVFTNPATKIEFKKRYPYIPKNRLKVARFGLPVLDEIEKTNTAKNDRAEICRAFGLPVDKVLIFVGYNANLAQQQLFVIERFAEMSKSIRDKAALIFTLGYGDSATEEKIKKSLKANGIDNFFVLNRFYGFGEVAQLRCITDVLINIQPTDQFSGSMQETLYAGGRVIAGKWLPYGEIINIGAEIISIATRDEIRHAMELEINRGIKNKNCANKLVKSFIEKSSSWKENLKIWRSIIFP